MKRYSTLKSYSTLKAKKGFKRSTKSSLKKYRKIEGTDSKGNSIYQVYEADKIFSSQIRVRDGKCVRCGSFMFQTCSHFFKRAIYSTRFDPENCDDFCSPCHEEWEGDPTGEYREFKIKQLGKERFSALEERSKIRISPTESVINFMNSVDLLKNNDIQY